MLMKDIMACREIFTDKLVTYMGTGKLQLFFTSNSYNKLHSSENGCILRLGCIVLIRL